jgi:ribosomal protein S18 acetylase RimI-like enzyme
MRIRPATQDDRELLWEFLAMAAYEPDPAAAKAIPVVAAHLEGWKRPSDFGFIAERDGEAIGAVWARQYGESPYLGELTREITIAVRPAARGGGVGASLLHAAIDEAAAQGLALWLDVRETNPVAMRLYQRLGFRRVPGWAARNRTGSMSFGMIYFGADD